MITFQPRTLPKLRARHTPGALRPSTPAASALTHSEGNINTAARRRAGRARCRGRGARGVLSPGSQLQPLHARGYQSHLSPRRAVCSRRSPAPPRGLLQSPPGPLGEWVCRGAAGAGAGTGRVSWRGRRTRARRLSPTRPPESETTTLLFSNPRSQAPVHGGLQGLQRRSLGAPDWLASPATLAPASLPSSPGSGQGSKQASPGAPGFPVSFPNPTTASALRVAREQASRRRGPQGAFRWSGSRRLTVAADCHRRESGEEGGKAPRRWLLSLSVARFLGSVSPKWAPRKEQVPGLCSAPERPTIAPAGSGVPANLQPRARTPGSRSRPLPAGVPASTAAPHETAAIPRLLGGWGGCVCARVCVSVCLIASLLLFPSLSVRLLASVPHPRSLTHRQRGRTRDTHAHTHAHAGYMNGRREPILRGWANRGARALGAGPHHGAGGRHAGDALPTGPLTSLRPPAPPPPQSLLPSMSSLFPPFSSLFLHLLPFFFSFSSSPSS